MKSVHEALDQILPEIIAMSEDIYCHPELGFKEFRTRKKAIEALDKAGIPHEDVAYTGIRAVLDSGKPGPNIGLITEFDAVPTSDIRMPVRTAAQPIPAATTVSLAL